MSQLHLISRYTGAPPRRRRCTSSARGQWEKAKRKAAAAGARHRRRTAQPVRRRAAREGHAFRFGRTITRRSRTSFGFEETPDQHAAINAVITGHGAGKPMDRLVCGDVGFGKTEVALRAAFVAVTGGKQVAILAPTTLLAEQHSRPSRTASPTGR